MLRRLSAPLRLPAFLTAGVLAILVYAVGLFLLVTVSPFDPGNVELATFVGGFGIFMAVYFFSMWWVGRFYPDAGS